MSALHPSKLFPAKGVNDENSGCCSNPNVLVFIEMTRPINVEAKTNWSITFPLLDGLKCLMSGFMPFVQAVHIEEWW